MEAAETSAQPRRDPRVHRASSLDVHQTPAITGSDVAAIGALVGHLRVVRVGEGHEGVPA